MNVSEKDFIFENIIAMLRYERINVVNEWIDAFEQFLVRVDFNKYEKVINEEFFRLSGMTSPSINKATSMRILGILLQVWIILEILH